MPSFSELMRGFGFRRDRRLPPSTVSTISLERVSAEHELAPLIPNEEWPLVMIVGRAGTGKSTLVQKLANLPNARQVVLAPTGVAALTIKGQTIHSFFGLPPRIVDLDDIRPSPTRQHLYQNLDRIIIDEISMVRADLIDAVDKVLRINRNSSRPFGGVKLVFVGDFLQLPPVVEEEEGEFLAQLGYESPYVFSAKSLQFMPIRFIKLNKVRRQDDPHFINLLGNLRSGIEVEGTVAQLNARCHGPHKQKEVPIVLTSKNSHADNHNEISLKRLSGPLRTYNASVTGDFNLTKHKFPAPVSLQLKVGARVMMVKNDAGHRWVNGSLGTVTRLSESAVWVRIDKAETDEEVKREKWEKVKYRWSDAENRIYSDVVGTYSQFPMRQAWAVTIHKAQGLTLENVRVDLRDGTFESGQAYVAISRARSIAGLSFAHPLTVADVRVHSTLLDVDDRIGRQATHWDPE